MRLANFLNQNLERIICEWESLARTLIPTAKRLNPLALRDHIEEILALVIEDILLSQEEMACVEKSPSEAVKSRLRSIAEIHAGLRLESGFSISQIVSEYSALRVSAIKLWAAGLGETINPDFLDLIRFNESLDQALAESISCYSEKELFSKDLFLGILSHDLRTPLGVVLTSAQIVSKLGGLSKQQTKFLSQIAESAARMTGIVNLLLDLTRARFGNGNGMPVIRKQMDMESTARSLINEMQILHPEHKILLKIEGNVEGHWDESRIGQVLSNLLGNAVQYSLDSSPITVTAKGEKDSVVISVHNEGIPIPYDMHERIFDLSTRVSTGNKEGETNLGLGLFITKEIVTAHGGTISVTSSEKDGTTFMARFPRTDDTPH